MGVSFGSIKIGSTANPMPTSDLGNLLQSHITQNCKVVQNSTQSTTCSVYANQCPDLKVVCENLATQQFSCDFSVSQGAAVDALSKEDKGGMMYALGLDTKLAVLPNAAEIITTNIQNKISQTCYSDQNTDQTLVGEIICNFSKDVSITLAQIVDQQAACSLGVVNDLAAKARKYAADQFNATSYSKIRVVLIILLAFFGFFIVGLMFLIGFT